jgi:DNA polymerase-3 subunit epsilon
MPELTWEQAITHRGMLGVDLETTSLDETTARVVTAATVRYTPTSPPEITTWLADPGIPIPAETTAVHGITTDHARRHGRSHVDVVFEVVNKIVSAVAGGIPLVVFHAAYDLTVLEYRCQAERVMSLHEATTELPDMPPLTVIDPSVIDRAMDPHRRGTGVRNLGYLCRQVHHIQFDEQDAHTADGDALAVCRLAWKMSRRYPHLARLPLAQLQQRQAEWYAQQQTERFGARPGVDTRWPMAPPTGQSPLFTPPTTGSPSQGLL